VKPVERHTAALVPSSRPSEDHSPDVCEVRLVEPVTQAVASAVVALLGSVIGLATRNTRRTRLRKKADSYTALADTLDAHDAATAATLRAVVSEIVDVLVAAERKSLKRRFNTDNFVGVIAFLLFAAGLIGIALTIDSTILRVLLYVIAALVAIFALIGGATQIWTHDDEKQDDSKD
jgi:hypothetical protein